APAQLPVSHRHQSRARHPPPPVRRRDAAVGRLGTRGSAAVGYRRSCGAPRLATPAVLGRRRAPPRGEGAGLKPRERELLWLAYAQGSSHQEIAATLSLKTSSIKALLFRARQRLPPNP